MQKHSRKGGGIMYPRHKATKQQRLQCYKCKKELSPATAFYWVDGCNCAITNNAPPYCKGCYIATYGKW